MHYACGAERRLPHFQVPYGFSDGPTFYICQPRSMDGRPLLIHDRAPNKRSIKLAPPPCLVITPSRKSLTVHSRSTLGLSPDCQAHTCAASHSGPRLRIRCLRRLGRLRARILSSRPRLLLTDGRRLPLRTAAWRVAQPRIAPRLRARLWMERREAGVGHTSRNVGGRRVVRWWGATWTHGYEVEQEPRRRVRARGQLLLSDLGSE